MKGKTHVVVLLLISIFIDLSMISCSAHSFTEMFLVWVVFLHSGQSIQWSHLKSMRKPASSSSSNCCSSVLRLGFFMLAILNSGDIILSMVTLGCIQ